MKDYLKVKILSLTEEAKIIRRLEQKRKRKASYARDLVHIDRRVAWHENQIVRLNETNDLTVAVQSERIQWHKSEIDRLKRQHNNTHVTKHTIDYNEKVYGGLHLHRIKDLRRESRSAYLAYAFLNGYEYSDIEKNARSNPSWERVKELVMKYGEGYPDIREQNFDRWVKEEEVLPDHVWPEKSASIF